MQFCENCHVRIRGEKETCVLCGNLLSSTESDDGKAEIFPEIRLEYESHLARRILIFISIAAVVSSFTIRLIFPTTINWPLFVLFGIISMWLSLVMIVRKRHNIPKTIVWQVTIVSILSVLWDWQTGWLGWSLDYLIPIIFVTAIIVMYITAKITRLKVRDYIFYALLSGFFGVVPVVFIVFDWVDILYPSVICVATSVIFLSALFIFQGENVKKELEKRMHI